MMGKIYMTRKKNENLCQSAQAQETTTLPLFIFSGKSNPSDDR